jgi:tRNA (guanine10-N2)-dimethyltransferase
VSETPLSNPSKLETFFCILSGENSTLPQAEVAAILESERAPTESFLEFPRMVKFKTSLEGAQTVARRAAYSRSCCREIFSCKAEEGAIIDGIRSTDFQQFLLQKETFKVTLTTIRPAVSVQGKIIKETLGSLVLQAVPSSRVCLERSDRTFLGLVTGDMFLFGVIIGEDRKRFRSRRPTTWPFFHPTAMSTKLARCMVNLSRAGPGRILLDPFCGTGSQLIEAALMGCEIIGTDLDFRMVNGTLHNLRSFGVRDFSVLVADAKALPLRSVDSSASDPPYGRGSSTHGDAAIELVKRFLENIYELLLPKGYICIAFPQGGGLRSTAEAIGYKIRETHLVREHKSLTREVVVLTTA